MTRSRSYTFKTQDGDIKVLTLQEAARHIHDPEIKRRFNEIILNSKNVRRKKDGFTPGWQENIQAYAGGPREYARMLKERGLVEIGYDYVPQESDGGYDFCQTEEFVQACFENGVELTGNEIEAIKSGDYFKD
jgi:hypothetical protein